MLVSLEAIVPHAFAGRYAVGAFNVVNIETTQAVLRAAEELKAPVIVQTSEKALDYAGFEALTNAVLAMARSARVPVVIHLDHGRSIEIAEQCLKAGYTSVMVDFSRLEFEQNIEHTRKVVTFAKKYGASVEGELGRIGGREDYIGGHVMQKTDPDQAADFIHKTGVSVLAVSIGNAHGITTEAEKLDFTLLSEIEQKTQFPLVLHGASGNTHHEIEQAIQRGVIKINIDTDLRLAFTTAVRKYLRAHDDAYDIREILQPGSEALCNVVKQKISLFGSIGKA